MHVRTVCLIPDPWAKSNCQNYLFFYELTTARSSEPHVGSAFIPACQWPSRMGMPDSLCHLERDSDRIQHASETCKKTPGPTGVFPSTDPRRSKTGCAGFLYPSTPVSDANPTINDTCIVLRRYDFLHSLHHDCSLKPEQKLGLVTDEPSWSLAGEARRV